MILIGVIILGFILITSMVKVVPQRTAIIVERLGKYRATYTAGFQIIIPFIDKIRYRHTLKEQAIDDLVQLFALFQDSRIFRTHAVFAWNAQGLNIGSHVSQFLGIAQGHGKRIHGRVVTQAPTNVSDLLDDHGGMLTGQLREGTVGTARTAGQVTGAADFIGFLASLGITLELQGLDFFTFLLIPDIAFLLNAAFMRSRGDAAKTMVGPMPGTAPLTKDFFISFLSISKKQIRLRAIIQFIR